MTFKHPLSWLLAGAFAVPAILSTSLADAACPQALATYTEMPGPDTLPGFQPAEINFYPDPNAVVVSNAFTMHLAKGESLQGHIIWNTDSARSDGTLMLNCPDGDVTGEEIRACTHWVGIIYAVNAQGLLSLMPAANEDAASSLILSDMSRALYFGDLNNEKNTLPRWDQFQLSGCQE